MGRQRRLTIIGAGLPGAAYPNATHTIAALRDEGGWEIDDRAAWLPEGTHLWRVLSAPWRERLVLGVRLSMGSLWSLMRCVGRADFAYAPYPSIFVLWWASWIPRRWRPRIVADAFVSIWDTTARDRGLTDQHSVASRMLLRFESRALRAAHRVVVDTVANRDWMIACMGLDPTRVFALPLAIDARPLLAIPARQRKHGDPLRVLFIGTLVPLHGIARIAAAVELLAGEPGIVFEFIADGREAGVLEALAGRPAGSMMAWRRQWASLSELCERIGSADVCLGVFGGDGKASRVLPFKVYMALAAGRAVLTQWYLSLPGASPAPPLAMSEPTPEAIRDALLRLRDQPEQVEERSRAGREYFVRHLGPGRLAAFWEAMLAGDPPGRPTAPTGPEAD